MFGNILHFIKYHNAVSLGMVVLLLSTGGALAASPDLREGVAGALLTAEQSVKTVDNTYIRDIDLGAFAPRVQVLSVTEDDDSYYVEYSLETIGLADGAWQPVTAGRTLTVSKNVLGERDLGLHVTGELKQLVDRELARLKETQAIERKSGEQQKVVATAYSGLIGKFLDPKEESFDGYAPVKPPPPPPTVAREEPASPASEAENPVAVSVDGADTSPPTFQILGNNPAMVPVRSNWRDLGAFVTDDKNPNIGYEVIGLEEVDLTVVGEYTITYRAVDQAGNVGTAQRTVIVFDPNAPQEEAVDTTATSSDSAIVEPEAPPAATVAPEATSGTTTTTSTSTTGTN